MLNKNIIDKFHLAFISYSIILNFIMNEDHLNLEIRKFLKKVGITSQRVVETYIKNAIENGALKIGNEIEIEMKLEIKNQDVEHIISDKLKIK